MVNAGVFGRAEYLKPKTQSYCTSASRSIVWMKSSGVSPGNPTIMSVEIEILRFAALIQLIRSRYQSGVYSLAIIFNTRARTGLHRQMNVVAEPRLGVDCFNNVPGKVSWVTGHKSDPSDSVDCRNGKQKLSEASLPFRIQIAVHVLTEQLDFCIAQCRRSAWLPPELNRRFGSVLCRGYMEPRSRRRTCRNPQ